MTSSTTRQLHAQQLPDGIVRETETTTTHVSTDVKVTRVWLDADRVHVSIGPSNSGLYLMLGTAAPQSDSFSPDEAEHLAKLLLDLAQQARVVQARKPWPGGPLRGRHG